MNWTNVVNLAELVSAVAALITVGLAFTELLSRSKTKKAAMAMDLYAEFLFVRQQVKTAMGVAKSFASHYGTATDEELVSFAQANKVPQEVFTALEKVTKEGVSSFDCFSKKGKQYSTVIMECTGSIQSLLRHVNAYLEAYSTDKTRNEAKVQAAYEEMVEKHHQVYANMESASLILKDNLQKTNRYSEWYLIILFIVIVTLLTINFML